MATTRTAPGAQRRPPAPSKRTPARQGASNGSRAAAGTTSTTTSKTSRATSTASRSQGKREPMRSGGKSKTGRTRVAPSSAIPQEGSPKKTENRQPVRSGQANIQRDPDLHEATRAFPSLHRSFLHYRPVRILFFLSCMCAAFVLLHAPAQSYMRQQNDLAELRSKIAVQTEINNKLQNELQRWDDNSFVKAQARERLAFVVPGEKPYRVMGWDLDGANGSQEEVLKQEVASSPDLPWHETLLNAIHDTINAIEGIVGK